MRLLFEHRNNDGKNTTTKQRQLILRQMIILIDVNVFLLCYPKNILIVETTAETLHRYWTRFKLSYSPVKRPGTVTNRFVLETKFQRRVRYYGECLQVLLKDLRGFFLEFSRYA